MVLANAALAANVYFQVNGRVDLGSNSVFRGTVIANGAISLLAGASLQGRGLSTAGTISLHNATASNAAPAAPLPVELTAFGGRWAGGAVELTWSTASEKNSRHFVVERATGADAAFRAVGPPVAAAGTSSAARTYQLRDAEAAALPAPVVYYRLRQVDFDGTVAYSPVVTLAVPKAALAPQLAVYPNPAADAQAITVRCANLAPGATVQTYSPLGQLLSQLPAAEGAARLALPALAPGLYQVVLRDAAGRPVATQRLVIGR